MTAPALLAEIGRLYKALRARPDFCGTKVLSPESQLLEDQIRTLSDRYKRQTEFRTTTDDDQPRVADLQYEAASP